jgi:hypothetical protein
MPLDPHQGKKALCDSHHYLSDTEPTAYRLTTSEMPVSSKSWKM